MAKTTLRGLMNKATRLSTRYLPYKLDIERDNKGSDKIVLIAHYGMEGSDVIFVGTIEECDIYLQGMKRMADDLYEI